MAVLRASVATEPLNHQFWLTTAKVVLEQAGDTLNLETITMLATCSDQANKSKVLGSKGLSEADPLAFLREKASHLFPDNA